MKISLSSFSPQIKELLKGILIATTIFIVCKFTVFYFFGRVLASLQLTEIIKILVFILSQMPSYFSGYIGGRIAGNNGILIGYTSNIIGIFSLGYIFMPSIFDSSAYNIFFGILIALLAGGVGELNAIKSKYKHNVQVFNSSLGNLKRHITKCIVIAIATYVALTTIVWTCNSVITPPKQLIEMYTNIFLVLYILPTLIAGYLGGRLAGLRGLLVGFSSNIVAVLILGFTFYPYLLGKGIFTTLDGVFVATLAGGIGELSSIKAKKRNNNSQELSR